MNFVFFCHSLRSDWNHGNAHFLRGVATELLSRGHGVTVFEPENGWSIENLRREHSEAPVRAFHRHFPMLSCHPFVPATLDLDRALQDADVVIVHEWNDHDLVRRLGMHRAENAHYHLLFHDTHHRSVTERDAMEAYDLQHFDGVLAFGGVLRDLYVQKGWARRAWTWHEAADTRIFRPLGQSYLEGDLVWVGNWGDEERAAELREFLIEPVKALGLRASVYGVRYPDHALAALAEAGIAYCGWIPNYEVPAVLSRFRATVHIPRRPYAVQLPGIPTIRPFEAMACGIPLVSAPWDDVEGLFMPGKDFLMAGDGREMTELLGRVLTDAQLAASLVEGGLKTVLARHTCAHRVDELLDICASTLLARKAS